MIRGVQNGVCLSNFKLETKKDHNVEPNLNPTSDVIGQI